MYDYEIRIVTQDYRTSHIFPSSLPSDFAAIRRAHALMRPGQGVEVWRGGDCIYANHRNYPLTARLEVPPADGFVAVDHAAMDYEIRILRDDLKPSLIWKSFHQGDEAAIRAGVRAAHGHPIEIWRDMDCIFRAPGRSVS